MVALGVHEFRGSGESVLEVTKDEFPYPWGIAGIKMMLEELSCAADCVELKLQAFMVPLLVCDVEGGWRWRDWWDDVESERIVRRWSCGGVPLGVYAGCPIIGGVGVGNGGGGIGCDEESEGGDVAVTLEQADGNELADLVVTFDDAVPLFWGIVRRYFWLWVMSTYLRFNGEG